MRRLALMPPLAAALCAVTGGASLLLSDVANAITEELIVTARQREESLQDVPASITAFQEQELERIGVQRAEDFINLTPGVALVNTVEVGDSQLSIRGLNGARDGETNFAFIIDGVLYTNPSAFNREFSDLQQIEVLKGPQGALYGRSAAAGAVIVTTKKPGNEFGADIEVTAAEYGTYTVQGTVDGPLISDQLYGRFSADYRETDGYLNNTFLGDNIVNDYESYTFGGRLLWEPSDNLSVDTKFRYADVDAASIAFNASFALPLFVTFTGNPDFFENANDHNFIFAPNVDPENEQETTEFSVKADYDLGWATLSGWGLYSDQEQFFKADGTSGAFGFYFGDPTCIATTAALTGTTVQSPTNIGPTPTDPTTLYPPYSPTTCDGYQYQERNQEDLSLQVTLTSPGDQRLRWQVGAYWLDLEREVGVAQLLDDGGSLPNSFVNPLTDALVLDTFDTSVVAVFGNVNYDLNDDVELSLALRYDREDRDVSNNVPPPSQVVSTRINYCANPAVIPAGQCTLNGVPLAGTPLNPAFITDFATGTVQDSIPGRSEDFSQIQPKVSLSWDATENFTGFFSWGIGFKSGGFNNLGGRETIQLFLIEPANTAMVPIDLVAPPDIFEKETTSAFELGFKSSYFDNRLEVNGALFHTDVDDMQFFEFFVGSFGLLRVVDNINAVELQGLELSAAAEITDNFSISAGYSLINSEIEKNDIRPNTEGNDAPNTPEFTFNFATEYVQPIISDLNLVGRFEYSYIGDTWYHTVQDQGTVPATVFFGLVPGLQADFSRSQRDAYGIANLRVGIEGENWRVVGFVQNLFDEEYLAEVITAPEFGGSFVHPGGTRTAGVEFGISF